MPVTPDPSPIDGLHLTSHVRTEGCPWSEALSSDKWEGEPKGGNRGGLYHWALHMVFFFNKYVFRLTKSTKQKSQRCTLHVEGRRF